MVQDGNLGYAVDCVSFFLYLLQMFALVLVLEYLRQI